MQKIQTLFVRDPHKMSRVTEDVNPACAWVLDGWGRAYVKRDGTSCMKMQGVLWKRYDCKKGRTRPDTFISSQPAFDGHWPGWVSISNYNPGPADQWHCEAVASQFGEVRHMPEGTYELIGPKINGNPEGADEHRFIKHDAEELSNMYGMIDFEYLRKFFENTEIEGIVWHRADGVMAKVKRKDFGFEWPVK